MVFTPLFILFLFIVLFLVWQFVKTIDNRKWLTFLVSVIVTPLVYFYMFYPALNIFSSYHHEKHFESTAWKEKPALRYEMSTEILDEQLFIGKSKSEIQQLLGKAEWYGWDDSIKANSDDKWNYNLGYKPGALNTQQECLEIIFKNDMVLSGSQYQMEKTDY